MSSEVENFQSLATKVPRVLSCVLCQRRKIKCDRVFPCSNCKKLDVKCTPSTPAPSRKRRQPNQHLQERLARCEELLREYATEKPAGSPRQPAQVPAYDDVYLRWQPVGKLVKEDGAIRFMDSILLGTICDELRALREIVDSDDNNEATPDTMTLDDNSDLLLVADSPAQTAEDLWPEPGHVFRLWQIYLDRVNPLTKIIHVPTLQPFLAEAANGFHNIPKNVEALLFSIFLMAVVSLTPEECLSLLGYSREQTLQRFSDGVRRTLVRMGFLKNHDLTTLQALVIYLISLQGRYNRHAAWVLSGVVIRIAQKMGLHRDGEILGLGPFDCEMRRRLWWQIIMLDAKYAMFSGLSPSLLPRNWDTRLPKNVNDADIYPSATEPFLDREGPTEMIFCHMTYRIAKCLVQTPGLEAVILAKELGGLRGPGAEERYLEGRRVIEALSNDLVLLLDRYCDPSAGPIHKMTLQLRAHIFEKLNEYLTSSPEQSEWANEVPTPKDNMFKIALNVMEHNEPTYHMTKDQEFLWFSLLHFQPDLFIYLASQLCHRTEGNLVERAWRQVAVVYQHHPELFDMSNKRYSTMAFFVLKAWNTREGIFRSRGQQVEAPPYVQKLRAVMPDDYQNAPTPTVPSLLSTIIAGHVPKPQPFIPDPTLDQFLGDHVDVSTLDWDIFENMSLDSAQPTSAFNQFGLGPSTGW